MSDPVSILRASLGKTPDVAGSGGGGMILRPPLGYVPPPFNPITSLSGVIGWWDASVAASLTLSGSTITNVADQSGQGNHLGDGTTTSKPSYSATGFNTSFPCMNFSANVLEQTAGTFPMGTGNTLTLWSVFTMVNPGSYGRLISYVGGGQTHDYNNVNSYCLTRDSTAAAMDLIRNSGAGFTNFACTTSTNHRIVCTIDSSGVQQVYLDGVAKGSGVTVSGNWTSSGLFFLGQGNAAAGDSNSWDGKVCEVGVATGFTNSTTAAQLDTYLKNKWGL